MRLLLIFAFLMIFDNAVAQVTAFGTTSKTSKNPTHVHENPQKRKHLLAWIKTNPKNTLTGNKCMEEVANEMGFEYVLQPKGQPGNRSEVGRLIHNFGVKTSLFFKNGPFWKFKLKKRLRDCKASTGDYVG